MKTRINLSVPHGMDVALKRLARHERVPVARKALDLLRLSLEAEEDSALLAIAESRERRKTRMVSHASAWK